MAAKPQGAADVESTKPMGKASEIGDLLIFLVLKVVVYNAALLSCFQPQAVWTPV